MPNRRWSQGKKARIQIDCEAPPMQMKSMMSRGERPQPPSSTEVK